MTDTEPRVGVWSEIGKLRRVLVCPPGLAHERLTPDTAGELLYDEVLWVQQARRDHYDFVAKRVIIAVLPRSRAAMRRSACGRTRPRRPA
jgi:arginine deiminase